MQFLDEKAKLFGKINIIDLMLIVLGVFVIIFIIIFMQFYKYPKPMIYNIIPASVIANSQTKIQVTGSNFSGSLKVYLGDEKVTNVNFINDRNIEFVIPTGLTAGQYKLKVANKKKSGIYANALTIKPIKPQIMEKWLRVKVKISSLPFELSANIKEGSLAKDSSSRIIAKITKVISSAPSKIMVFLGSYKLFDDPIRKDVVVLCEILANLKDDNYYYQNQIVKLNRPIKFSTGLFDIRGSIIDIEK